MISRVFAIVPLLFGWCAVRPAVAAEGYDNCNRFIDSVPMIIETQGVWCLRHDLATANASGNAIEIRTNNVTIDCNDFKLGGLAAGSASQARGIYASSRQNITVRRCNVRGFLYGIYMDGGAGHLIEDNRLDNNLYAGIKVLGAHNRIWRNAVFDTGGYKNGTATSSYSYGINAEGDIVDNVVDGVSATGTSANPYGIVAYGVGGLVTGNRIGGLQPYGGGTAYGILSGSGRQRVAGNHVVGALAGSIALNGYGIFGLYNTFCTGNTVPAPGFATAIKNCQDAGGNF
jgi:parallel beta-helix repeat protein